MPAVKTQTLRHVFGGGWSTDFGPTVDVQPDQNGRVVIPYLLDAEDLIFELDGAPHKIGGTSKVNSTTLETGSPVMGVYDYWRHGTAGSPARRRVVHCGTRVLADADDATFTTELANSFQLGAVPAYATFDDLLIFSSDSTADVPRSWDQTTAQNLAGTPPRFSFSKAHKNRLWAAGVYSAPSTLYYSSNTDPEDWTTTGGSIDIDPNDGDIITGLETHKDELWVFKGPNKGSIHRITGSAPTGADAFARKNFVTGLGASWHNAIFKYADDIGFVSQFGTVHSLAATAAYGDFIEASLSRPINVGWIRDHLNYNRLRNIWAVTDPLSGLVFITGSWSGSTSNNKVLVMDFRNAPEKIRWSKINAYAAASLGLFVDTNGLRRVLAGGNDGYVRRLNVSNRSIDDATALSYKFTTPFVTYGDMALMKTLEYGAAGIVPKSAGSFTFGWTRDGNTQQTASVTQGGTDVLGTSSASQFTLGDGAGAGSTLGGASRYVDRYFATEEGGEFRSIQYQITNSVINEDLEVHSFGAGITPGAVSLEN